MTWRDPLHVEEPMLPPEPDRPTSRRMGCSVFAFVLVVFAASVVPGQRGALDDTPRSAFPGAPELTPDTTLPRNTSAVADAAVTRGPAGTALPLPTASGEVGTALVGGLASWYDDGPGYYAAAGPLLRDALSNWRGATLRVESEGRSVFVEIRDFCACGPRHGDPTIIDLSPDAFAELAPLSKGIIRVSIEIPTLPQTDADQWRQEVTDSAYEGGLR